MSEVRQVGIVGGGFMGSGIAESVDRAVSGRTPC
jgi:3-hydroxyacyl-CoA dehydrogenase